MPAHKRVYLDYNATAPVHPAVIARMAEVMHHAYNPASVHNLGREAAHLLEKARQKIAISVGAQHARVIFTSSGTEANNLALRGLEGHSLAVSAVEHVSVLAAAPHATVLPVNRQGIIDLEALEIFASAHAGKPFLVSVMWANNETGIIQPTQEIAHIIHKYNGLFHCDASQALGKIPVNMLEYGVDMLTVSAHKMGGPQGAAALVITKCVPLKAQLSGGGQESGFRAGTPNMAAIVGFAEAVGRIGTMQYVEYLRDAMEAALDGGVVIGKTASRLPNTSVIALPGVSAETQLIHFDLNGVAVSAGSACTSGKVGKSHVLEAMQVESAVAACAIRVSLGMETTKEEIDTFVALWQALYDRKKTTPLNAA